MIRHLRAAVAALLLLVLWQASAHATASGAITCSGVSTNFQNVTCPDINEEITNLDRQGIHVLESVAGTNTITASGWPYNITAYVDGQTYRLKPANNITGPATLSLDSVGAKAIVKQNGDALASGDLLATTIYVLQYYAADDHFRVIGAVGTPGADDDIPESGDFTNLTGGSGIDNNAGTLDLDLTEINSATLGSGTFTTLTYNAGAVDPVETFGSGTYQLEAVVSFRQADAANAGGQIKLLEDPGTGSNFISFLAPASITSDVTCTLENDSNPIPDSCVGDGTDGGGAGLSDADYGDITVSGGGTVMNIDPDVVISGATPIITIAGTDAGAAGPVLKCQHDSATPADGDVACDLQVFAGADDEEVGRIALEVDDGATTTEDTRWNIFTDAAGTSAQRMAIVTGVIIGNGTTDPGAEVLSVEGSIEMGNAGTAATDTTLARSGAGTLTVEGVGIVRGATGGTDNSILRADGTGGTLLQNSVLVIADTSGAISGAASGFSIEFFGASGTDTTLSSPGAGRLQIEGAEVFTVAGSGLTNSNGTLNVGAGTCITSNANDVAVTADCIGPTQIDETATYAFSGNSTVTGSFTFDSDAIHIFDTNASHDLIITPGSDLTADRVFTLTTGDAARTLTMSANATLNDADYGDITTSSSFTSWQIDADAVGSNEIAANAVAISEMADDAIGIDELDLVTGDTPVDGDCLTYDAGTGGGTIEAITCPGAGGGISNVVEDTTPQLGGALDTNGFGIEFGTANTDTTVVRSSAGNISIEGNVVYRAGGTDVALADGGTGASLADPGGNRIMAWDDTANAVEFQDAGAGLTAGTSTLDCDTPTESAVGCIELATTAEAEAGTDTSRAVTAAGVLAAVTGKKPIWLPGGSLVPRTTNGCAVADLELGTNDIMLRTCNYDTTTEEGAGFTVRMPDTWNEGTVTFVPVWTHPATVTNFGVVWSVSCLATSNDDAMDAALGTPQTSTDTGGTTSDQYTGPESAAITCAGSPQAGDTVYFEIERTPGAGSDTLAVDAYLLGVTIYYTDNAFVEP